MEQIEAFFVGFSIGFYSAGDTSLGARFFVAAQRLGRLRIEATNCARTIMRTQPMSFGYAPRKEAYPRWANSRAHQHEHKGVII